MDQVLLDDVSRQLHDSRAELRAFLGYHPDYELDGETPDGFPRSRLMRSLTGGRVAAGLLVVGAIVFAFNPRLGMALVRKVPIQMLASRLLTKLL